MRESERGERNECERKIGGKPAYSVPEYKSTRENRRCEIREVSEVDEIGTRRKGQQLTVRKRRINSEKRV